MPTEGSMDIDLNSCSLDDLKKLHRDVSKAIATYGIRRKQEALAAVETILKEHGFSLNDLIGGTTSRVRRQAAPKYRHPENPSITWSGRGRPPAWIKAASEKGQPLDQLLIHK